jgi:hypothetical protein
MRHRRGSQEEPLVYLHVIRWSAEDLARETALSVATIRRAELREKETSLTTVNDLAIRRAFESVGVEFIDENGGGPGVDRI